MAHVFISYKRDKSSSRFISRLGSKLRDAGLSVWIDTRRLRGGDSWFDEIDKAVRKSSAMIIVITPDALKSEFVMYEWAFARGAEVRVIPILYKHVPQEKWPHLLRITNFWDFTKNRSRYPWDEVIEDLRALEKQRNPGTIQVPEDAPLAVKQAAAKLNDDLDEQEYYDIAVRLAMMENPSADELLKDVALCHHHQGVRRGAVIVLGLRVDPRFVPVFEKALQDQNKDVRRSAIDALQKIADADSVLCLLNYLEEVDEVSGFEEREYLVKVLVEIGDRNTTPVMLKLLDDEDPTIRASAASFPWKDTDTEAIQKLMALLHDKSSSVRAAAVTRLGEIGHIPAIPVLIKRLRVLETEKPAKNISVMDSASEQMSIVYALRQIGTPEALDATKEYESFIKSIALNRRSRRDI